jgi:predicted enzyme related to lactoylglutathione lyase
MATAPTCAGAPCWFDLASTDPGASRAFHTALFGWTSDDIPMGDLGAYTMLANAHGAVGALSGLPPGVTGVPSHWNVYFLVEDCDAATARAVELGASVLMAPFDVQGFGRMSALRDPTGAAFSLWQSRGDGDPVRMGEDHAVCWVELATRDAPAARAFYTALLGWTTAKSATAPPMAGEYHEYTVGGQSCGGFLPMDENWGDMPPAWAIYIQVPDVDACLERARALGGSSPHGAFDAPGVGRIGIVADPTGAHLYVIMLAR